MQVPFLSAARMRMSQVPLGRMPPIVSLSRARSAPIIKYIFAQVEWRIRVWPTRIIIWIISPRLLIAAENKFQRHIILKIRLKHNLQISPAERYFKITLCFLNSFSFAERMYLLQPNYLTSH